MTQLLQVQIWSGLVITSLVMLALAGLHGWIKYLERGTPEQQTIKTLLHLGACLGLLLLFGKL